MAVVPITQKERDDGTIEYLEKVIERIRNGEVVVEQFSACVEFGDICPGDVIRRQTRTMVIVEVKPR